MATAHLTCIHLSDRQKVAEFRKPRSFQGICARSVRYHAASWRPTHVNMPQIIWASCFSSLCTKKLQCAFFVHLYHNVNILARWQDVIVDNFPTNTEQKGLAKIQMSRVMNGRAQPGNTYSKGFRLTKGGMTSIQVLKGFSQSCCSSKRGLNTWLAVLELCTFSGWKCLHRRAGVFRLGAVCSHTWSSLISVPGATPARMTDISRWHQGNPRTGNTSQSFYWACTRNPRLVCRFYTYITHNSAANSCRILHLI